MTQAQSNACEHCGAPLAGNTTFCGSCGKPVTTPKPGAGEGGGGLKKTMFGIPQDGLVLPVSPRNSVAPAPVANVPAKPEADPSEAERAHDRSTQEGVVVPPRGQMGRTMLGVPMVQAGAQPAPANPAAAANVAKTMYGLGGIEAPKPPSAGAPPANAAPGKNTMMGTADTAPMPEPGKGMGITRRGHVPVDHTLMSLENAQDGGPVAGGNAASGSPNTDPPPADPAPKPSPRMLPYTPSGDYPRDSLFSTAPAPARRGSTLAAMVLFGLLAVTAAVLGYLALAPRGPDVRVHVVSEAGRDTLEFEVPGAEPDTKVRFGGQEQPLIAGRARFALAADAIRVGENVVLYDLIKADGNAEPGKVGIAVDYRATLDTGPLRAGKAAVDVVVSARPGSKVWLDGVPIMLDKDGRAVRSDPIELGGGQGSIEHVVKYRVEPPGAEAVVGELHTTLALTSLTIDRPGPELVTDQSSVEIAGEVEQNATVTIDGRKVEVRAGRFLDTFPLPKSGDYQPIVSAMAEGKAPRAIKLKLTRVDDLAKAAQSFKVDSALSYAKIAQNPTIYKGQRVAFEGRIYNVSVDQGHSALQMLVRQCPKGQRCPLWVSYPAATDLTVDSWVRALGTLDGEQQFRSETNELRSVPKLVAAFLVPTKP